MGTGGFFTRQDARERGKKRAAPKKVEVSDETLHKLGEKGVRRMNPDAVSPNLPADLASEPGGIYILGEFPERTSDEDGAHFHSNAGRMLLKRFPNYLRKTMSLDYIVRTRTEKDRPPTRVEIECYRPSVEKSIAKAKPRIVVGLGKTVLQWMLPGVNNIKTARGRRFPVELNGVSFFFYPLVSPALIQRLVRLGEQGMHAKEDGINWKEWRKTFERDVKQVVDAAAREDEVPQIADEKKVFAGCNVVVGPPSAIADYEDELERFSDGRKTLGFDLETHRLRPYWNDSAILSIAVSDGKRTTAIGLDHPHARWGRKDRARIDEATTRVFEANRLVDAHNLAFDIEWLIDWLGEGILDTSRWGCSMQAAYILDQRRGGHSLEFLCRQEFGLPVKKFVELSDMKTRLREVPLRKLLRYNALDAKWAVRLARRLRKRVKTEGLGYIYERQIGRVIPCVLAQRAGMSVDSEVTVELKEDFEGKIAKTVDSLRKRPEVKIFERSHGRFNPASPKHVAYVLRDILKRDEGKRGEGYSTDDTVLSACKIPFTKLMLAFRDVDKLRGTYVERMLPTHPDTLVYPDGKIHYILKTTWTGSGRLASEDPNGQNWPKRKAKHVRRQIVAGRGHVFLSVDQGQIEARVLGMASRDRAFVKALWEDYDVHREWAEKVAKIHPPAYKRAGKDIKKFRGLIKNQMVFPAFYGAHFKSIAGYIGIPDDKAERLFQRFWRTFAGVKQWQRDVYNEYQRAGYVECLTGRRRYGPLSWNQVINTPIQGTASDLVVASMEDLSVEARESDRPFLQPVLNVHDDLTFRIPKKKIDEAIEVVVQKMLTPPKEWQSWINVPLTCEVEVGENWYEMREVGTFRSDKL